MKRIFLTVLVLLSFGLFFTACSGNIDKSNAENLAAGETYTCEMHNEVMSDHPGECHKCGMSLIRQKRTPEQERMMKDSSYEKPKE